MTKIPKLTRMIRGTPNKQDKQLQGTIITVLKRKEMAIRKEIWKRTIRTAMAIVKFTSK